MFEFSAVAGERPNRRQGPVWFVHLDVSRLAVTVKGRPTWRFNVSGRVSVNARQSEAVFELLEDAEKRYFEQHDERGALAFARECQRKIERLIGQPMLVGQSAVTDLFGI